MNPCRKDSPEEMPLGRLLHTISHHFRQKANDNLTAHGITFEQLKVLAHVSRMDGKTPQAGLEEVFGVRKSSMTAILQNMEKAGLLLREADRADARIKNVILTEKGAALDRELRNFVQRLDTTLTEGFTPGEREAFRAYLIRALFNLDQAERNET